MVVKTFETKYLDIDLKEDYTQFFDPTRYNWIDFEFIKIHVEADRVHGMFEIQFALLGLGIRFYWTYNRKALKKAFDRYEEILAEDNFVTLEEAMRDIDGD